MCYYEILGGLCANEAELDLKTVSVLNIERTEHITGLRSDFGPLFVHNQSVQAPGTPRVGLMFQFRSESEIVRGSIWHLFL